ncbi:ABC transporter permease [Gleimia hominis]|uniref:ABC transporter permease n=1 Tax=Gleimia hominis TaxID=595468 RepID=UPI000C806432|nr:ABC transporter permease [Gleimia hominis]WIK63778.1 ABC transporter permease [Gleimia hominis]
MVRSVILTKYHLASLWNWRSVYLSRLVEPVAYFVFLVAGISGMVSNVLFADYALYALTGIFCLLAFRTFTFTVSDVSNDRKWGVYAIFNMQGGSPKAYLLTIITVSELVFSVQVAILMLAWGVTDSVNVSGNSFIMTLRSVGIAFFIVGGWSGIGAAIGALVDSYSTRDMISTLTSLPIVLSAPLFYTLDSAPEYLVYIAQINPLTYHVQWVRDADTNTLIFAIVWALVCFLIGTFALQRADRVSTER